MVRTYGWSESGERCVGKKPGSGWKTVSLIGAIRLGEKPRLMTHRGAVNTGVFVEFTRRTLLPFIGPGDVVVMDNLAVHKAGAAARLIEKAGARVLFMPPYSPELNPIELWWAKLKGQLRSLGAQAVEPLLDAVRRFRASLPLDDILGWFAHVFAELQIK